MVRSLGVIWLKPEAEEARRRQGELAKRMLRDWGIKSRAAPGGRAMIDGVSTTVIVLGVARSPATTIFSC
jgi:hypothetical protein